MTDQAALPKFDRRKVIRESFQSRVSDSETYLAASGSTSTPSTTEPILLVKPDVLFWIDAYGDRYLDFTSGGGVMNLGWGQENLMIVARQQLNMYSYTGPQGSFVEQFGTGYARILSERFPEVDGEPQRVLYTGSSALAKQIVASWYPNLVTPGQVILGAAYEFVGDGVAMEFVRCEDGFTRLDTGIAQRVAGMAKEAGVPVIAGEHQTAFGRTGAFLAQEEWGVQADITILGEAGGAGFPFGAIVAAEKWFKPHPPMTLPANEIACAVGAETMIEMVDPVFENARDMGHLIDRYVGELIHQFPKMAVSLEGYGLAKGLRLSSEELTEPFVQGCRRAGLIVSPCATAPAVIRLTPPIIINDSETRRAVDMMAASFQDIEDM